MDTSFHSLRHTAVSLLKDAGIPDAVVLAFGVAFRYRDSKAIMISLRDFDLPDDEPSSPEDIVHDWDDPNDFSWWQPAFDVLAPPDAEKGWRLPPAS